MNSHRITTLYITYDGLLDPLGASQILPYIKGVTAKNNNIVIMSFEKPERFFNGKESMLLDLESHGIKWKPLLFTKKLGSVGKSWDLIRMYIWSLFLSYKYGIYLVHARGHLPAQVGYFIKRILQTKLLFDFRGLWVDERVDKGGWDLQYLSHRLQYKYFKRIEKKLLSNSDHVVVLTNKIVDEVISLGVNDYSKITVIPCCADFDHFHLSTKFKKIKSKEIINMPKESFVLGYLGSVGSMYLLDRFFRLFELACKRKGDCYAFVITSDIGLLKGILKSSLPKYLHRNVYYRSANRDEVPILLPAIDIMVSFILPTHARRAASPTKIAESFSVGVPVISNSGVGDVNSIIRKLDGGIIVNPFSDSSLADTVDDLELISSKGGRSLRDLSRPMLGLEFAIDRYRGVYQKLM